MNTPTGGHRNCRLVLLVFILLIPGAITLTADDSPAFGAAPPDKRWTVTTRWDYRVRIDGQYLGFTNRELREVYDREEALPDGWRIAGEARILGATKKDGRHVAARLEGSDYVTYVLGSDGSVRDAVDGYPRLRGFPTFPREALEPGDRWEAPLDILVYGPEGGKGVLSQIASYQFVGSRPYMGRDAHYFEVTWALRFRGYDPDLGRFLNTVEGSHKVSLVMDADTLSPIMARDTLSERWEWADSRVEQRDGFALIFWDGVPPMDKGGILREFEEGFPGTMTTTVKTGETAPEGAPGGGIPGGGSGGSSGFGGMKGAGHQGIIMDPGESGLDDGAPSGDIVIVETPRGVSVTLRNLHFKPDLAELLPGDRSTLDDLAGILDSIPDRTILVRGHTADVGRPEDEYDLSEERARVVADAMSARGIDPRRLIYEGVGADEPVASNDTEEGKRRNRRVELLILED